MIPQPFVRPWPRIAAAFALLLACAAPALAAIDEDDLLPVDEAFVLSATAPAADRIRVEWKIADGYYLYRHRIGVQPDAGFRAGELQLPRGERHTDEFFGEVETYRGHLAATLPGTAAGGARQVVLKVKYQGCADLGVCYPPQARTVRVNLPAGAAPAGVASAAETSDAAAATPDDGREIAAGPAPETPAGIDPRFAALARSLDGGAAPDAAGAQPLPPEQAFGFEAIADGGDALLLRFTPAPGYYLYRDHTTLALDGDGIALEAPRWPRGVSHRDEHFGEVVVYFDQVEVPVPLRRAPGAPAQEATLTATFQGCQDGGICYPPMTRSVRIALPSLGAGVGAGVGATEVATGDADGPVASSVAATAQAGVAGTAGDAGLVAEDTRLAAGLSGPGRWAALLWFFLGGLALAFTPCVLPMIPILSGLIAGAGARIGTRRALWLSFVYVLASALVFTAAGVVAGLVGANLQVAFQVPWVIAAFALLFVALALSSFGLYELQLPAALRAKLGNVSERQRGGSLAGVAAMGALSALIVGPCVAPPLAASVLYISQTRDPLFGGLALFVLAMGMGLPLLAFGAAAGRGMPTSGPWMTGVQRAFGFVFLALAVWMLSRILPGPATLALYGVLALAAAAWAWGGTRSDSDRLRWAARFAGLLLAVVGSAQLFGALAGGGNPLRPLAGLGGGQAQAALAFRTIKSSGDLDRELAAARAAGKPLLFDFYADWCVSCKEMEAYTFTDPVVQAALADFVLLKADVTANDEVDQALMRRFGIVGPPATLFFNGAPEEIRGLRLVGFEKAAPFTERVRRAAGAR